MHGDDVGLHLLPRAARDHRSPLVVDGEHELVSLVTAVPEMAHEDHGDVAHEVDRVVPHDRHPFMVPLEVVLGLLPYSDAGKGQGHAPIVPQ